VETFSFGNGGKGGRMKLKKEKLPSSATNSVKNVCTLGTDRLFSGTSTRRALEALNEPSEEKDGKSTTREL